MTQSTRINLRIQPDLHEVLTTRAAAEGIPVTTLVTQYIQSGLQPDMQGDTIRIRFPPDVMEKIRHMTGPNMTVPAWIELLVRRGLGLEMQITEATRTMATRVVDETARRIPAATLPPPDNETSAATLPPPDNETSTPEAPNHTATKSTTKKVFTTFKRALWKENKVRT